MLMYTVLPYTAAPYSYLYLTNVDIGCVPNGLPCCILMINSLSILQTGSIPFGSRSSLVSSATKGIMQVDPIRPYLSVNRLN